MVSDIIRVDQDFANIWREVIPDGPDDQTGFKVNQNGRRVVLGGTIDGRPELHQVGHVPLKLFGVATNAGGTGNNAHAWRNGELVHRFAQLLTLFALDTARHTAAAWIVRHQNQIAARQRNEGCQGGTLVTTLFFLDLND